MKTAVLNIRVPYLFFPLFFLFSGPSAAKHYLFQQIPPQNGLSSMVRCLEVSPEKGYVWIGTRSGIGRFDGYEQKRYLRGNVTHLLEDDGHTLWGITEKGVFRYDASTDEFILARDKDGNPVIAGSICRWKDGVIFGGRGRLYKYSYEDRVIRLYHTLRPNSRYNISNLCQWDENTLLAANRWAEALFIDIRTGKTRPVPFDSRQVISLLLDRKGNVWIAHYHQGVKCYDRNGKLLHSYNTRNSGLKTDVVLSLAEHNGQIWAGTDGAGITVFDPERHRTFTLEHLPGDRYSLPANSILCLYNDKNNNMWAGSVRNGLINIKEAGMRTFADALPGQSYGLSEKTILSLYQDDDAQIWIGTDGGGINRLDPATGKFHHILSTWGEKAASITGMGPDHLLVSLFSKGLFVFDKQTNGCRPLVIVNDSINSTLCYQGKTVNVYRNSPETILLLAQTPYSYHIGKKQFTPVTFGKGVSAITGTLLPIGSKGNESYLHDMERIYKIDARRHELEVIYRSRGDTVFNSVSQDGQGVFWIGTNYGLSKYNPVDKQYATIPNTLINEINSLVCDRQGRVWIGTEGKLFAHLTEEGKFILFGEPDGVMPNEYLEKPRLLSSGGDVYMGGVNGLLQISRRLPDDSSLSPTVRLAGIQVGGERVNDKISKDNKLCINEKSKPVVIKIITRNKDIFRKPMYRYTLTGLNGQSIYSYLPEITLNSLPSGTYQIKAACSTRSGDWTEDNDLLTLVVLPPWYRSGWFILCCSLFVFFGIALTFVMLLRRKENRLKWAMKEHEQHVYEEKVRFLINISHELRTPLTLIHAPLKQLMEKLPAGHAGYPLVQGACKQSERMRNILDTVLDVRKMEVGQSTLHAEDTELDKWVEQLVSDFRPEAAERSINLVYQPDPTVHMLCLDQEKCTTILTNLLINALKYTPDGSCITVSTRLSEGTRRIRISVSDQGPGLKNVDMDNLFVRFYQGSNSRPGTGIGLSYSKILAEQHGGSIGAYDNENGGATFWFELPSDILPGNITLHPQAYLNALLAPAGEDGLPPAGQEEQPGTTPHTLLIADDNKDLTDYLHITLREKFREVWVAGDGAEALRICRERQPDIVVSDIQMPCMNGYELCRQIKEDLNISHIPVILLTARNDEESRLCGYKNGADAYMTKPFEVNMLAAVIRTQLDNRERIRTRYAGTGPLPLPEESTFSSADEGFLNQLNKIISAHLDNGQMGIPFICGEMGISRASLYNKLKALTNMGANDYITKIRMERAIWLITHTELSINEIADETGFSTARYFSTVFKQYTGCTPTRYRERLSGQ